MVYEQAEFEAAILEVLRAMRENPEKYQEIRRSITEAQTDEEKVSKLLDFATDETELAALIPAHLRETEEQQLVTWTTVTVTTVTV